MAASAATMDDLVVDMVLKVDSRGIDVEDLARRIRLPGMEILRSTAHATIWLTALIVADGQESAIRQMRDEVWSQLPESARSVAKAEVSSIALGDLYACLESVLADEELAEIDIRDLVARTLWDRPPAADLRFDEPTHNAPVLSTGTVLAAGSA